MSYVKDPRVDAYLAPLPAWQREICSRVRDLAHAADPDVRDQQNRQGQEQNAHSCHPDDRALASQGHNFILV